MTPQFLRTLCTFCALTGDIEEWTLSHEKNACYLTLSTRHTTRTSTYDRGGKPGAHFFFSSSDKGGSGFLAAFRRLLRLSWLLGDASREELRLLLVGLLRDLLRFLLRSAGLLSLRRSVLQGQLQYLAAKCVLLSWVFGALLSKQLLGVNG